MLPKVKRKPFDKEKFMRRAEAIQDKPIEKIYYAEIGEVYPTMPIGPDPITMAKRINELIDYITELEDRVRQLESNSCRGHR